MSEPPLLLVVPVMPAEAGNGLAMRAGLLLEGLARAGAVRVLIVPVFGDPGAASPLVERLAESVDVLALDPHPDRAATPEAARSVAAAAEGARLVLAMRLYLAPFLDALLDVAKRPRVVLDVDDVESATHRQLGRPEEAARYARLEARYLPLFDRVLVCSRDDAEQLGDAHGLAQVTVIPNAVRPPPDPPPEPPLRENGDDLIFVGNLSYAPNVDGALWLCREIMPRLDGVSLAIVGSNPRPELLALAGRRITVAADVPDVAPWYAASRVAVAPLRAGGGTRIKVLEAFAYRRPVVATATGIRGLGLTGTEGPALVAEDPDEFATACRRLLDDPDLAARLALRGAEIVAEGATVDVVAAQVAALVGGIFAPVNRPASGPAAIEGIEMVPSADGYVVYDEGHDRVHYLNHTAALVLEFCTGDNGPDEIVRMLQLAYDLPQPPQEETLECLAHLRAEGLVR